MKNRLIIVLLAAAAGLYSCNKSGSITRSNQAAIVGTWAPATQHSRVYNSTTGTLVLDTTYTINSSTDTSYYYETFNSNNTAYITSVSSGKVAGNYTYKIITDQLALYQNGNVNYSTYYTILNLTSSSLALETQFAAYPAPGSSLNTTMLYNYISDTYFNKH